MGVRSYIKNLINRKVVDTQIEKVLLNLEVVYDRSLQKWYRSSLINLILVVLLAVTGLYFSRKSESSIDVELFISAILWLITVVFVYRRVVNVLYLKKNWSAVREYGPLLLRAWWQGGRGNRLRSAAVALYNNIVEQKTTKLTRGVLRTGARWNILPGQDEVFDRFWVEFRNFARTIVVSRLVQFLLLCVFVAALGWFVRDAIQVNLHETSLTRLYVLPFTWAVHF